MGITAANMGNKTPKSTRRPKSAGQNKNIKSDKELRTDGRVLKLVGWNADVYKAELWPEVVAATTRCGKAGSSRRRRCSSACNTSSAAKRIENLQQLCGQTVT